MRLREVLWVTQGHTAREVTGLRFQFTKVCPKACTFTHFTLSSSHSPAPACLTWTIVFGFSSCRHSPGLCLVPLLPLSAGCGTTDLRSGSALAAGQRHTLEAATSKSFHPELDQVKYLTRGCNERSGTWLPEFWSPEQCRFLYTLSYFPIKLYITHILFVFYIKALQTIQNKKARGVSYCPLARALWKPPGWWGPPARLQTTRCFPPCTGPTRRARHFSVMSGF